MILFLFFCSGATALIYEVVWSKYLALMFGSTIHAQTVVLAVFMAGLAIGNWWFGRSADVLSRPLAVYGYIEIAIGLFAFFFETLYSLGDKIFVHFGSNLLNQGVALLCLKGALSVGLLILPTILMGGTLPLLAAWLQKHTLDPGRRSARFYSVNSLGAVAGAGLGGFVLIRELGMVATLQATAIANVIVGGAAIVLSRFHQPITKEPEPEPTPTAEPVQGAPSPSVAWACTLVTVTGGISMGLEVLASRTLSMIFGASLQSFAMMLIAFILGIGLGSAAIASPRFSRLHSPTTLSSLLLGAAFCVAVFIASIEMWAILYAKARTGLASTEVGYIFHEGLTCVIAIAVLGVPAGLLGAVLPLLIRILSGATTHLGDRVGRLLTWNTLGAVTGVLLTGFVLMPKLGLRDALTAFTVSLTFVAAVTAWLNHQQRPVIFSIALAGVVLWINTSRGDDWKQVLSSGIFRLRTADVPWNLLDQRRKFIDLLFYEDGPDATVTVETGSKQNSSKDIVLRVNGKPDASTAGDLSTQYLLAHLSMFSRPQSKDVFVLGYGSGITAGALLGHPIERLTIAENCQPVLNASKYFESWNRGVLTNSRTRIFQEDGRTVLKLDPQKYDVIISEPSNPWVAGVGSVFSKEYYELATSRLKEGGIMAQWFHMYEMHDGVVFLVVRTFASVFPYMEIWDTQEGDIIMLGSQTPWKSNLQTFRDGFSRTTPRQDLERIGLRTPESVFARQVASQQTAFAIAGGSSDGPIQSDAFPVLEYVAPKAFYIGAYAQQLFLFDERTWQTSLAPPEKTALLASLQDDALWSTISTHTFSNRELLQYLQWRRSNPQNNNRNAVYPPMPYLPIAFRSTNSYPRTPEIPPNASADVAQLLQAQALVFSQPSRWEEGVRSIETVFEKLLAVTNRTVTLDWLPGHFASVAARTRLNHRDPDGARKAVELGLKLVPTDAQLLYLQRILDRQEPKKP